METVSKTKTRNGVHTIWVDGDSYNMFPPPPLDDPRALRGGEHGALQDLESYLKSHHGGDGVIRPASCLPGEFHPRIWRGAESPVPEDVGYGRVLIESVMVCREMSEDLRVIFSSIHPELRQLDVFGNRQRELLLLACTDVESAWRAVLRENTGPSRPFPDRLSTQDYVRLLEPMRLNEWKLELLHFPQLGTFIPFANWDSRRPTTSLPWYDAYNAIKHDREAEMSRATLRHAIDALAALHVMIATQFGIAHLRGATLGADQFRITSVPEWPLEDYYTRPRTGSGRMSGQHLGYDKWTRKPLWP